jgi:hypothetical protein
MMMNKLLPFKDYIEMRNGFYGINEEFINDDSLNKIYQSISKETMLNIGDVVAFINHLGNLGLISKKIAHNLSTFLIIKRHPTLSEDQKDWIIKDLDIYLEKNSSNKAIPQHDKFLSSYFVYSLSKRHSLMSVRKAKDLACYFFNVSTAEIDRFTAEHFSESNESFKKYILAEFDWFPSIADIYLYTKTSRVITNSKYSNFKEFYENYKPLTNYRSASHKEIIDGFESFKLTMLTRFKDNLSIETNNKKIDEKRFKLAKVFNDKIESGEPIDEKWFVQALTILHF